MSPTSVPPTGTSGASLDMYALTPEVRRAYEELYESAKRAFEQTNDPGEIQNLGDIELRIGEVLAADDLVRIRQDAAEVAALKKAVSDANAELKQAQRAIEKGAKKGGLLDRVMAGITKVLSFFSAFETAEDSASSRSISPSSISPEATDRREEETLSEESEGKSNSPRRSPMPKKSIISASSVSPEETSEPNKLTEPTEPRFIDEPGLHYSQGTEAVLKIARGFGGSSSRPIISSSCLLFAMAENGQRSTNVTGLLRKTLNASGSYEKELEDFQRRYLNAAADRDFEDGNSGLTINGRAILRHAAELAQRVTGSPRIHRRHLVASLLVAPAEPLALTRLARMNVDLARLKNDLLLLIADKYPRDNQDAWQQILWPNTASIEDTAASSVNADSAKVLQFLVGAPGYNSEFCGLGGIEEVPDHLNVEAIARRFAELIVLRETRLPLAIGLFGNWGSGKSHFMNLVDRNIQTLAQDGTRSRDVWCGKVVPIYFNAWHYSDANLWASLVTEVFDALFEHLQKAEGKSTEELAYLEKRLREARGVTAMAAEVAEDAKVDLEHAAEAVVEARTQSERAGRQVAALLDGLKELLPETSIPFDAKQVLDAAGISHELGTLSELTKRRRLAESLWGRARALRQRAFAPEGRWTRVWWFAGLLAAVGISWALNSQLHAILEGARWLGPWVRTVLLLLSAALGWLGPIFKHVQRGVAELEALEKRAEEAQKRMPADPRVIKAEKEKARAEAKAKAAMAELVAAQSNETQLNQLVQDASPQRRLGRFIEARARASDYRGQLGLVSLARRDFEELSRIFTDAEAMEKRIKEQPDEKRKLEGLNGSVDRVVLFIDDLDRCEPEKIVDVLQAVHLLLAFRLFVVVVGVDQRALRQSLRMRFKGLVTSDDSANFNTNFGESPATPLDYLEKIFHIPFHLPPMDQRGFERLVENLTKPTTRRLLDQAKETIAQGAAGGEQIKPVESDRNPESHEGRSPVQEIRNLGTGQENSAGQEREGSKPTEPQIQQTQGIQVVQVLGSVPLESWERTGLNRYSKLIRTPRGVTRLLNTYRLVRAGLPLDEWAAFRGNPEGTGEARLAMLLLAVAAGQPAVAREWFNSLAEMSTGVAPPATQVIGRSRPEWEEFCLLLSEFQKDIAPDRIAHLKTKWLDRIERFTF